MTASLTSAAARLLQGRTKDLKFGRSRVHAWGLFAMETIEPGDFVIEYVGELIRLKLSDAREAEYEASGLGSSYLFRIDLEWVVDATKKVRIPLQWTNALIVTHACNEDPADNNHCRARTFRPLMCKCALHT